MKGEINGTSAKPQRTPWNKGKINGARPPLRTKDVWSIRNKLQLGGRFRDLAMFDLAIDSKPRGCDVMALKVEDVAPHGAALDRATVRQRKTGHPVRFELRSRLESPLTHTSRRRAALPRPKPTTRQYSRLVSGWIASIGVDASFNGTHSLRRTKATLIYRRRTGNLRAVQLLLGKSKNHVGH